MIKKQDSIAVANFVIERALDRKKPVTKLQLQKIMFLLQGYWLEKTGQELFCETIKHGRLQPLILSVEKEFDYWASAPIENKAAYFSCNENRIKEATIDQKLAKKLRKITNEMLDYNRRNMINLFFENDKSKQPMGKVQILAVLTMDGCLSSELYDKAHQDLCLDRCGLDEIRKKAI